MQQPPRAQGFGGPSCARMLTTWFASKERGTYWGLWNIAHNFGGFLAPIIAGTAAGALGWRWGMYVPGIMGIAMGLYVLFATSDSPEKAGFPPVEVIKEVKKADGTGALPLLVRLRASGGRSCACDDGQCSACGSLDSFVFWRRACKRGRWVRAAAEKPSMMSILLNDVLKNVWIWGMAITYFFIYVIRQGVTSWCAPSSLPALRCIAESWSAARAAACAQPAQGRTWRGRRGSNNMRGIERSEHTGTPPGPPTKHEAPRKTQGAACAGASSSS